ncbi:MAG: hypothetical protein CBB60_002130, partial [Armatimonadetes bacterium Cent15-Ar3]
MLRTFLASVFRAALTQLVEQGRLPNEVLNVRIEIADPKNPEHGDFACNIAMTASKLAGKNPREFAEMLVEAVSSSEPIFEKVEIAGPGFINLTLNSEFVAAYVGTINSLSHGDLAKQNPAESPLKINVEFVSVNPNGPITIGSGRGAAYGSTLCNIFEAAGHTVHREYYINDGVNSEQMRLFAESVRALIKGESVPDNGYKGDYVKGVSNLIQGIAFVSTLYARDIIESGTFKGNYGSDRAFVFEFISFIRAGYKEPGTELPDSPFRYFAPDLNELTEELRRSNPRPKLSEFTLVELCVLCLGKYCFEKGLLPFNAAEITFKTVRAEVWSFLRSAITPKHERDNLTDLTIASVGWFQDISQSLMILEQRTALAAFGVNYDTWFSEQSLHDAGTVAAEIDSLAAKGIANTDPTRTKLKLAKGGKVEDVIIESQTAEVDDEGETNHAEEPGTSLSLERSVNDSEPGELASGTQQEGSLDKPEGETLWLRSTKLGDDMDRVLLRKDGRLTYIASDVAYHKDKFNRPANADKLITILGPDHHGYIGRLTAVVAAMLLEPSEKGEP